MAGLERQPLNGIGRHAKGRRSSSALVAVAVAGSVAAGAWLRDRDAGAMGRLGTDTSPALRILSVPSVRHVDWGMVTRSERRPMRG